MRTFLNKDELTFCSKQVIRVQRTVEDLERIDIDSFVCMMNLGKC